MTKRSAVRFNAKITPVKPLNDEFTLCKCYVMALNKNRNLSYIGRDASDEALPTLYNIPVVGHLYIDEKGNTHMGGHDYVIADDSWNSNPCAFHTVWFQAKTMFIMRTLSNRMVIFTPTSLPM